MTQPNLTLLKTLETKLIMDRKKLSRHFVSLSLALVLTAVAGSTVQIAQAKEKSDEPGLPAGHHSGPHACMPPGPPLGLLFEGPPGPPLPPPPFMALPLMGVDLTDDQIDKLAQLHTSFMERAHPAMFKLHSLEEQFRIALTASNINVEELNGLRTKIAAERVSVDAAMGDFAVAQAQILTPEQRHKIKIDMEKMEIRAGFGPPFGPH